MSTALFLKKNYQPPLKAAGFRTVKAGGDLLLKPGDGLLVFK